MVGMTVATAGVVGDDARAGAPRARRRRDPGRRVVDVRRAKAEGPVRGEATARCASSHAMPESR